MDKFEKGDLVIIAGAFDELAGYPMIFVEEHSNGIAVVRHPKTRITYTASTNCLIYAGPRKDLVMGAMNETLDTPGPKDCTCGVMSNHPDYDLDHELGCPRYKQGAMQ